ncbi:twin-arginine translocase subunit TatC [Bdellovibrionota bacterium]
MSDQMLMNSPQNPDPADIFPKFAILDHIGELRSRLTRCALVLALAFFAAYTFREQIFHFLKAPLLQVLPENQQYLHYTGLLDELMANLKLSLFASIALTMPVILFQGWRFISPGLRKQEKKFVIPFVLSATLFFLIGMAFAYYIVFPYGFKFLLNYSTVDKPILTIKEYLSLSTKIILLFGVIFELPMVLAFLGWLGILNTTLMRKNRRYAILIIAVAAAVLTPTQDAFTMGGMALLMYLLFEASIILVGFVQRKRIK